MAIKLSSTLLAFIFLLSINCYCQKKSDTAIAVHYQTKDFNVAIFPANYHSKGFLWTKTKKRFTPTKNEIDSAEMMLKEHLKDMIIDTGGIMAAQNLELLHRNMDEFRRQYFGYTLEGHRILYINAFCGQEKQLNQLWLSEFLRVFDGGSCFWQIKFDLITGKLFELWVNGEA
jgi:hypothetical protein